VYSKRKIKPPGKQIWKHEWLIKHDPYDQTSVK
jgi:hypothetical protein